MEAYLDNSATTKCAKEVIDVVVKAINEMVQLVIDSRGKEPEHDKGKKAVGNIVFEMRKDLLGKTELTADNFRYTDVIE